MQASYDSYDEAFRGHGLGRSAYLFERCATGEWAVEYAYSLRCLRHVWHVWCVGLLSLPSSSQWHAAGEYWLTVVPELFLMGRYDDDVEGGLATATRRRAGLTTSALAKALRPENADYMRTLAHGYNIKIECPRREKAYGCMFQRHFNPAFAGKPKLSLTSSNWRFVEP